MRITQNGQMKPYGNLSGDSSVMSYKIGDDFIEIKLYPTSSLSSTNYRFTYESAGRENVEEMKQLAQEGRGLNNFLKFNARDLYERKW